MPTKSRLQCVFEFRPVTEYDNLFRWDEKTESFIEDDGEYGLAFYGQDKEGFPITLGVDLPYSSNILWKHVWDGNWGAHVSKHPSGNAWHYETNDNRLLNKGSKFKERNEHINEKVYRKAMSECSSKYGCANGRGVEFNPLDETIMAGLLRDYHTKKVIKAPTNMKCIYCGKIKVK